MNSRRVHKINAQFQEFSHQCLALADTPTVVGNQGKEEKETLIPMSRRFERLIR